MKTNLSERILAAAVIVLLPLAALGVDFEVTPAVQAELDRQKAAVAAWAADPVIVAAVREQNRRGPTPTVDNDKWKTMRRSDPFVRRFQTNAAGELLREKQRSSAGAITELFLNAAKGEKVAFAEKTTSYIHAGADKHDVPFESGEPWQGEPAFDQSTQTYAVQVSVPVFDRGKPIGSLVAGVNLSHLRKAQR